MLPQELSDQLEKGISDTDSIEDVFKHFQESELANLNEQIPDDFWGEERLNEYVINHKDQFISMD